MFDLVIRGGTIVDGTGAEPHRGDIGIRDGRIASIDVGGEAAPTAKRTVDAQGLVVAPGFIDIHTHYDAQLFWDPACTPSSLHGVTTVFGGNCGFSIAPLGDDPDYVTRMLSEVEGIPLRALDAGVTWNWKSFGDYLDRIERSDIAVNIGASIGHSALRRRVLGTRSHDEAVSEGDLVAMREILAEGLDAGAVGFSSSWGTNHLDGDRNPVPSRYAAIDELVALAGVLKEYPGAQLEFIPTNGDFEDRHLDTMTKMALAGDTTLNWNLLTPVSMESLHNRLSASEHASARGATVLGLSYPDVLRTRSSFLASSFASIPGWSEFTGLSRQEKVDQLRTPAVRAMLREAAETTPQGKNRRFETLTVSETYSPGNEVYRGRRLGDLAGERQTSVLDLLFDIAVADDLRTLLAPEPRANDDEAWKARITSWKDPRVVIGASDGGAHVDVLATFDYPVRFLALQRERGVLSLAETVRKLTDVPAHLYGVTGRGRLEEGYWADIVIFDADVVDTGPVEWRDDLPGGAGRLYSEPRGVPHVLVRGIDIVADGQVTGQCPGQVLRRRAG